MTRKRASSRGVARPLWSRGHSALFTLWTATVCLTVSTARAADGVESSGGPGSDGAPAGAGGEASGRPAAATEAPAPWRLAVRLTPPLGRTLSVGRLGDATYLGGAALALTAPQGWFVEASAHLMWGSDNPGHEASLAAGYVLLDRPRPGRWHLSVPLLAGYRRADRPPALPTDGHSVSEGLDLVFAGARAMVTRTWTTIGLELGAGLNAGLPVARRPPTGPSAGYYQDPETRYWLDAGVFVGLSFGL